MPQRDERLYLAEILGAIDRALPLDVPTPEIPWGTISGTRDRLIHGYFSVDLDIIWDIVQTDLPRLRGKVAALVPSD